MTLTVNVEDLHIERRYVVGTSGRITGLKSETKTSQCEVRPLLVILSTTLSSAPPHIKSKNYLRNPSPAPLIPYVV